MSAGEKKNDTGILNLLPSRKNEGEIALPLRSFETFELENVSVNAPIRYDVIFISPRP